MTTFLLCTVLAVGQPSLGLAESLGLGVVLLDSGQLHEGKIDQLGDFVRVMSGGRSTVLRKANVAMTGETKDDAYQYLRKKKKSDSASDAAGLAEWCRKNGMMKLAVEEAKSAVRLAPTDRGIAKLAVEIEEDSKRSRPILRVVGSGQVTAKPPANVTIPVATIPTMVGDVKPASTVPAALEQSFARMVQPMLMNACANCHADASRAVAFRISRIPDGITVSPKSAENATAAINQVSKVNPLASPLVVMAIKPHGGRTSAPLDRSTMAFKNLESWATAAAAVLPAPTPVTPVATVAPATPPVVAAPLPDLIVPPPAPTPVKAVDPFDPAEFNRASPKKP